MLKEELLKLGYTEEDYLLTKKYNVYDRYSDESLLKSIKDFTMSNIFDSIRNTSIEINNRYKTNTDILTETIIMIFCEDVDNYRYVKNKNKKEKNKIKNKIILKRVRKKIIPKIKV